MASQGPHGRAAGYSLVELMAAITITLFIMAGIYGLMLQNQHIYEQQTKLADTQQAARVALDFMVREIRMAGSDPTGRAFTPSSTCENGAYKWPSDPKSPASDDVAPLTVATATKIRIKMDRPTFTLPAEPPVYSGNPHSDGNGDGDYDEDDEFALGDGFIDDEGEDVTYEFMPATKRLLRTETRTLVPAAACRTPSSTAAASAPSTILIADHIQNVEFDYYSTDPPATPCPPYAEYADSTAYEAARDVCDPPLSSVSDFTAVRRVRVRVTIETSKPDPYAPKTAPKFGHQWITLTSEAAIRNR